MFSPRKRWFVISALLGLVWLGTTALAPACPFCLEERGPTLIGDFAQAEMVLLGTFHNPRPSTAGIEAGATDFKIEKVLKPHDVVKGKQSITVPRLIQSNKSKFLIFCDVYKDNIDPYRGVELAANTDMVNYLTGAMKVKDKTPAERLRYCFDFLQNPEFEISLDAYREYAKADYKDYSVMAKDLDPKVLTSWLEDPKTPSYRYGLYASLLGHCGNKEHAKILRTMIDDPEKSKSSGIDGILFGYMQLDREQAWAYLTNVLKNSKDFGQRYAALRTCRFLYNDRWDLLDKDEKKAKDELVRGVLMVTEHRDMADFAIEDLRRWKRWELSEHVLDLFTRKSHDIGTIKRSVLRYALRCPTERAKKFVQEQRRRDKEWVADTEELLQLEDPAVTGSSGLQRAAPQSALLMGSGYALMSLTLLLGCGYVASGLRRGPRVG